MAPPDQPPAHRARLYLVSPRRPGPRFARAVEVLAEAGDVACLLLSLEGDEALWRETAAAVLPVTRACEIALLLDGHPSLAVELGADGAHIRTGARDLVAAKALLKPDLILGAGGLATRHAAMEAGEAGVDYVAFGEPHQPADDSVEELASWWAELFEVPCVAFANDLESAARLSRKGADFVALGAPLWDAPEGAPQALARLERLMAADTSEVEA